MGQAVPMVPRKPASARSSDQAEAEAGAGQGRGGVPSIDAEQLPQSGASR
jgi:hypothetical protein